MCLICGDAHETGLELGLGKWCWSQVAQEIKNGWFFYFFYFWGLFSKSACTEGGLLGPVPCKVPSAPDLAGPRYDFLNSTIKKLGDGHCKVKLHAPYYGEQGPCKGPERSGPCREGGLSDPVLGKVMCLNSHQPNFLDHWFFLFLLINWIWNRLTIQFSVHACGDSSVCDFSGNFGSDRFSPLAMGKRKAGENSEEPQAKVSKAAKAKAGAARLNQELRLNQKPRLSQHPRLNRKRNPKGFPGQRARFLPA